MPSPYVPIIDSDAPQTYPAERFDAFPELAHLIADERCTDVLVNGSDVWVDLGRGLERRDVWLEEPAALMARRLIEIGGRHLDEVTPIADVRIGSVRVHAVLPPISNGGALISLRVARMNPLTLDAICASGTLTPWQRDRTRAAVEAGERVLVTGGTATGKTTLLRAMLAEVPTSQRIITVEDVVELQVTHPHAVALESRQANLEGAGAIGLDQLVRAALRMRPDWLVVGECRGREVAEFLAALNTGHVGAGTLHANSLADVPARFEALGALAGFDPNAISRQVASAFDLVIHLERRFGRRECAGLARMVLRQSNLTVEPIEAEQ